MGMHGHALKKIGQVSPVQIPPISPKNNVWHTQVSFTKQIYICFSGCKITQLWLISFVTQSLIHIFSNIISVGVKSQEMTILTVVCIFSLNNCLISQPNLCSKDVKINLHGKTTQKHIMNKPELHNKIMLNNMIHMSLHRYSLPFCI